MNKTITFKISVYSGDIIFILPGIREACRRLNAKAVIYFWLDRPWGDSYPGAKHPYGMNQYAMEMMIPLLEKQEYIHQAKKWEGEDVTVDLDKLRSETITTMPHGSITHWPGLIWPDMQCDTSNAWIRVMTSVFSYAKGHRFIYTGMSEVKEVEPTAADGKILINRTSRWRNDMIHYWFLRKYQDQLIFSGLDEEHVAFCKEWELEIPLLKVKNFWELAIAIRNCKFMIGNQSLNFALAEAMKTPRILEVCTFAPNVHPVGEHGYYFQHQWAFEWLVEDLNTRTGV
jgi:hypothetical protein